MVCNNNHKCEISFANFKNKKRRCSVCYGNKKMTHKDVEHELIKEGYVLLNEYKTANEKIEVKCAHGHIWITTWGKFQSGRRCPFCSGKFNSYKTIKEMIELENGYKLLSHDCKKSNDRIEIKCDKGHIYNTTVYTFKRGCRCPICNESKGEKEIECILDNLYIEYIRQYTFKRCKFKSLLPFDFYIPKYNCCVEYDGEDHYMIVNRSGNKDKNFWNFIDRKIRDTVKTKFCKENNIKLIRIPYWEFDNIENILIKELNLK